MAINNNAFFGPIANAIDIVTTENLRGAERRRKEKVRQEVAQTKESQFRRRGNLEGSLSLLRSGNLTPESSKAIAGGLPSIMTDPDFAFQPGAVQFQQPQQEPQFTTGQPEEKLGMLSGTKVPLKQAGKFIDARQKQTVPLSENVTKALGLPKGQRVPVNEFDNIYRAFLSKQRISNQKTVKGKGAFNVRQKIQDLENLQRDIGTDIGKIEEEFGLTEEQQVLKTKQNEIRNVEQAFRGFKKPENFDIVIDWIEQQYINEEEAEFLLEKYKL